MYLTVNVVTLKKSPWSIVNSVVMCELCFIQKSSFLLVNVAKSETTRKKCVKQLYVTVPFSLSDRCKYDLNIKQINIILECKRVVLYET